tara:strand:- start:1031 stop:1201 length:171 start_codon:yes stop_codon:yes gene_type:complete
MKKVFPIVIIIGVISAFLGIIQIARGDEIESAYYALFIGFTLIGTALIERKRSNKK